MPDNILKYIFRDKSGAKHTVWKSDYDADPQGFAKAYPDARFEVVNRKTGDRGHVSVKDVGAAQKEGFNLFTMKAYQKEHYEKPKTMKQRAQEVAAQYRKPRPQKAQQPRTATASGTDYMQNWRLAHMRNDQMTPLQQAQASNARARMQRAQEQSARQ